MRRVVMVLMLVGLLGAMVGESAAARNLTVRRDPNDSLFDLDIRSVATGTTPNHVVLWIRIRTWDRLSVREGRFIVVAMDTRGSGSPDRSVTIQRGRCRVAREKASPSYIGHRYVRRPTERSISCRLPLGWFDINKRVRFRVYGVDHSQYPDRAPNGVRDYVGLQRRGRSRSCGES